MEKNLTGLSVGQMSPNVPLTQTANHATYTHGIPGLSVGRAQELAPFMISHPDAYKYFTSQSHRNPKDLTGTIQKVFPHQVVDQQHLDQMNKYYTKLRQVRGFKDGGEVDDDLDAMKLELQKKGEPVTLSKIETNIKESINVYKYSTENGLTKVLLFPFRLVGLLIKTLGEVLKHLGPVARVLAGVVLMLFSLLAIVSVVAAAAAFFGVISGIEGTEFFDNSPFKIFSKDIHPMIGFFAFFATFTPFLALLLTGLTLLSNKRIGNRNFWVSLLGFWLAGLMGTGILATKYALNFKKKGRFEQTKNFPYTLTGQTLVLDANNNQDDNFDEIQIREDVEVSSVVFLNKMDADITGLNKLN
jgi:hypothetical protein